MNGKRILLLSVLLLQSLWLEAQTTLSVGDGQNYTISASANYTSVTIEGGSLTISSGAVVSIGTLTIQGSSTRTGVCTVKEAGTKVTVSTSLNMTTLNTSLIVSNSAEMTFGNHSLSAVAPYASNITVNSNAILHIGSNLVLGSSASLKFNNGDGDLQSVSIGSGAVFEVSGANADVQVINFDNSAGELRIVSAAKLTIDNTLTLATNSSSVLRLATGATLTVGTITATAGKIISDASSFIVLKYQIDNSVGLALYPTGSIVNIELDPVAATQIITGDNRFGILRLANSAYGILMLSNMGGVGDPYTEITSKLEFNGNRTINVYGTLTVTNSAANAISRPGAAFVTFQTPEATFTRYTNSTNEYFFPVGVASGGVSYRPVYLKPASSGAGAYSVKFINEAPSIGFSNIGGSIIPVAGSGKKRINNLFYHEIKDVSTNLNSPPAAIYIAYDPVTDASSYDAVAQYQEGAWQALAEPVSRPGEDGLSFAGCTPHQITASNIVYVLANSISSTIPPSYVSLKKKIDGGYYNPINSKLYFLFEEEYAVSSASLNYRVLNSKNIEQTGLSSLSLVQGMNRFELNIGSLLAGYYVLEVSNSKSEKWYLRFKK